MEDYKDMTPDEIDEIEEQDDLIRLLFAHMADDTPPAVRRAIKDRVTYFFGDVIR